MDNYNAEEYISEGEIYIQEFLNQKDIDSIYNQRIDFLIGDSKAFRMADFYIPRYDLYIEFFGQWNTSDEHRERYREKRRIYDANNLACIYIYPENLGILDYLFNYRAMKELKDKQKKKELFKLRWDIVGSRSRFLKMLMAIFIGLILGSIISYIDTPRFLIFIVCFYLLFLFPILGILYWKYRKLVKMKFHKERNHFN
jgi:hypothetical protein